jgi:16S rRNA (guanine527-N7)-methyltransferase
MNSAPFASEIQRILGMYGYSATTGYAEQVRQYVGLLLMWSRKVALTTITDPNEIVRFHFGESLFGMGMAEMQNGRLADLGSGAGFPGMPIAMARKGMRVVLIESNGKKAAFLNEIRRELSLKNVEIHRGRAEQMPIRGQFEFVAARALGEYESWLRWAERRIETRGKVVFWLTSETVEILRRNREWTWAEPARIPGTKDRFVLTGTANSARNLQQDNCST